MKILHTVLPVLGAALFIGGTPLNAAPVTLIWSGTIEAVTLDAGGTEYSGTTVGQVFSGPVKDKGW